MALGITGGVVAVGAILLVIGFVQLVGETKNGSLIPLLGERAKALGEAQRAPGAAAVRSLGCADATVLDGAQYESFHPSTSRHFPAAAIVVACEYEALSTPVSCADVAQAYVGAGGAHTRGFTVHAGIMGGGGHGCWVTYRPDGGAEVDASQSDAPSF